MTMKGALEDNQIDELLQANKSIVKEDGAISQPKTWKCWSRSDADDVDVFRTG